MRTYADGYRDGIEAAANVAARRSSEIEHALDPWLLPGTLQICGALDGVRNAICALPVPDILPADLALAEIRPGLELTLLGNFDELERIDDYEAVNYDPNDIVNLNHSNSSRGNVYRRKGSSRSREAMLAHVASQLEEATSDQRMATRRIERLNKRKAEIETADDLSKVNV
jgi:hypothetical protein